MNLEQAKEWLRGERSMTNIILNDDPQNGNGPWMVLIAQADAAMTEQAYWIVKAHAEGLLK
ncbi:MAG: hypothetical protein O2856_04010 [Planctomycetota bacterium]|nr:hypothetical protein [Planctomycetota bacterium]